MRENQAALFAARRKRPELYLYGLPGDDDLVRLVRERDELIRLLTDWPY